MGATCGLCWVLELLSAEEQVLRWINCLAWMGGSSLQTDRDITKQPSQNVTNLCMVQASLFLLMLQAMPPVGLTPFILVHTFPPLSIPFFLSFLLPYLFTVHAPQAYVTMQGGAVSAFLRSAIRPSFLTTNRVIRVELKFDVDLRFQSKSQIPTKSTLNRSDHGCVQNKRENKHQRRINP